MCFECDWPKHTAKSKQGKLPYNCMNSNGTVYSLRQALDRIEERDWQVLIEHGE